MRKNGSALIRGLKKGDLCLILFFVLLALGAYVFQITGRKPGETVRITIDGETFGTWPLDGEEEIVIAQSGWKNVVTIQQGCVDMTQADCPDGICVDHKAIRKDGETIVCLPHKVVVEIIGDGSSKESKEFDAMTK